MQELKKPDSHFHYVYSYDLDANIQIKIGTLEGSRDRPGPLELIEDPMLKYSGRCEETCSDLYVSCQVYAENRRLALPISTAYKSFSTRWNWNEWLTLPVKYSDLPRNAVLALTIWDVYGPREAKPVGGSTISLFGKNGLFRQGMHDLRVWPDVEADGQSPSSTPGKSSCKGSDMSRLAKLSKKHRNGHLPKVDWLDRLTFREIELINEQQKRDSNSMYLMIEFQHIHIDGAECALVYYEMGGDEVYTTRTFADIVLVPDPEIQQENLVESKHHKLARSLRSGPADRDLKPNAAVRDLLNTIVSYPPTKQLLSEETDLVWKFRYYLSSQKKALTKFLKSVNWSVSQEARQALDMVPQWTAMDVEDALELLTPAFTHPTVRKYAVARLAQAQDEDLLLYLLQLVQALKYENFDDILAGFEKENNQAKRIQSSQHDGPMEALQADSLHNSPAASLSCADLPLQESCAPQALQESMLEDAMEEDGVLPQPLPSPWLPDQDMDLATFLIYRACNNSTLANYFCWYLIVECDESNMQVNDPRHRTMYYAVLQRFSNALRRGGHDMKLRRSSMHGQQEFINKLIELIKAINRESGNRLKKIEKLQQLLKDPDAFKFNFMSFEPIPLPLDPDVTITGIIAEEASIFKSALMPCRIPFRTIHGDKYVTLFKHGDDLRQDQLILQMITLMDRLLMKENLDLKLTPYKVLAMRERRGFVQFIESEGVADVVERYGSILAFLRAHGPADNAPLGVAPEIMDNYIKSCAGYCVITYLLGVGDRHMENLLLAHSGKLFHIDFGFILGRDPKPLPPPMRLSKEMVEAMGGTGSEQFMDFKKLCYTAFLHLRRSANLILNLFALMLDANVPDIALEPDKTVKKVQDKFRLDLTDEEAVVYMQQTIDVSVSATVAALMEQMHKIAQYWRK